MEVIAFLLATTSILIKCYEEVMTYMTKNMYVAWLRRHHPESIPPNITSMTTTGVPFSGAVGGCDSPQLLQAVSNYLCYAAWIGYGVFECCSYNVIPDV